MQIAAEGANLRRYTSTGLNRLMQREIECQCKSEPSVPMKLETMRLNASRNREYKHKPEQCIPAQIEAVGADECKSDV